MDSEEPVFEAVLNWVKHNRKEREPYLPDMLEFVRMPLLTPRYITDVIDAEVNLATRNSSLLYIPMTVCVLVVVQYLPINYHIEACFVMF